MQAGLVEAEHRGRGGLRAKRVQNGRAGGAKVAPSRGRSGCAVIREGTHPFRRAGGDGRVGEMHSCVVPGAHATADLSQDGGVMQ